MATFVVLGNWTQQGMQNLKGAIDRAEAAEKAAQQLGARIVGLYWTLGAYDIVAVVEAPDAETVTALALAVGMQGNSRTTTMQAFGREEMARILDRVG